MGRPGATISVIDDDASVRKAVRRLIRSAGWDAEAFASAEDFLAAAGHGTPKCLIMDVCMRGMSGLELQQWLAALSRYVPIVFISGHEDEAARRVALEAGAVGFLQKPFDDRILLELVAKALAQPSSRDAGG